MFSRKQYECGYPLRLWVSYRNYYFRVHNNDWLFPAINKLPYAQIKVMEAGQNETIANSHLCGEAGWEDWQCCHSYWTSFTLVVQASQLKTTHLCLSSMCMYHQEDYCRVMMFIIFLLKVMPITCD